MYKRQARTIHWKASARYNRLQEKIFEPSAQAKALLVVDVEGFAKNRAEGEFERTLEIAASLAVRLERQGYALGLVTNGAVVGGGTAMLRIARNPQKLPAILELFARLKMEPERDLKEPFVRGLKLPWGVSAVHFSYEAGETAHFAERYFAHRKIPAVFIVARLGPIKGRLGRQVGGKIYHIDDIRLEGAEGT